MHRTHCLLLLAGYLLLSHSQPAQESDSTSNQIYTEFSQLNISSDQIIAPGNADFAFRLYHLVASQNSEENIFFSPLSISIALAMLSTGAGGNTQTQILEGLGFNLTESQEAELHKGFQHLLQRFSQFRDGLQLSLGSALFTDPAVRIRNNFLSAIKTLYMADTLSTNFGISDMAKKQINDYVAKQTKGKIVDLIKKLQSTHVMVLINYIFFKGKWMTPFDPDSTFESDFYLDNKRTVKVPMMKLKFLSTPYFRDEKLSCTVVELKYTGNASAMFILPDQGKMQQVEASLQPETLRKWRDSLRPRIDELFLPKFSISTDYSLEGILQQLGIRELFSMRADLSGITGAQDLRVSHVVHKAVLDVAETGTEAAAATGMRMLVSALIRNPLTVNFNRPFLMIITHTNTVTSLFMAKVTNPKGN
ncbi:Serine protease inhibitor A3F [Lemmus lemmus]